jgi:hypothetical protein
VPMPASLNTAQAVIPFLLMYSLVRSYVFDDDKLNKNNLAFLSFKAIENFPCIK